MTLQQLTYFCMVAKQQSISKAAEQAMVSEPALSKTIRSLETELGVSLFNRSGRQITLNEKGKYFYQNVSACLDRLANAVNIITTNGSTTEIRISLEAGDLYMEDMIIQYHKLHPDVLFSMSAAEQGETLFASDSYDLICTTLESPLVQSGNFRYYEILTEPFGVSVPKDDPLARQASVGLKELRHRNFVSTSTYGVNFRMCQKAGFLPNHVMVGQSLHIFLKMLENRLGISVIPAITIGSYLPSNCVYRPLADEDVQRTIVLVETRFRPQSEVLGDFIAFCQRQGRGRMEALRSNSPA